MRDLTLVHDAARPKFGLQCCNGRWLLAAPLFLLPAHHARSCMAPLPALCLWDEHPFPLEVGWRDGSGGPMCMYVCMYVCMCFSHPRPTCTYTLHTYAKALVLKRIRCIWWSTAPLITGALDEAGGGCAGCPCPFVYGVAGLLSSRVLAWQSIDRLPWTPPMRRNRAAIALGDKSNLRNPRSGTAHPRQKRNGTAAEQNGEAKEERSSGPPAWHDRGRLVTTYLT